MRSDAPPLLPIFRSVLQGDVLAALLLHPDAELTLTEVAARVGAPLSTVHAEAARLVRAGILAERRIGRARLVRANVANRAVRPLTELVTLTFGPATVVAEEFTDLPDVEKVLIFGSWAARYHGEPGLPPNDVDVLVVGGCTRIDMYAAAERAEARLWMPVNPVRVSTDSYAEGRQGLLTAIASAPTLLVVDRAGDGVAMAAG